RHWRTVMKSEFGTRSWVLGSVFLAIVFSPQIANVTGFGSTSFSNHINIIRDDNGALQSLLIRSELFSFQDYSAKTIRLIAAYQAGQRKVQKMAPDTSNKDVSPETQNQAQDTAL